MITSLQLVYNCPLQERKTDYSSSVERVKYNDFNHIRKYNQVTMFLKFFKKNNNENLKYKTYPLYIKGQFDHLSERRIPTRSSSTSQLPIQGNKDFY